MKKQQLERLRELEERIKKFKLVKSVLITTSLAKRHEIDKLKKEAQVIKDNWNNDEGCGKIFEDKFWGKRRCGEMEDLKHSDHYILCPSCKEQNKEKDEIFGRILG